MFYATPGNHQSIPPAISIWCPQSKPLVKPKYFLIRWQTAIRNQLKIQQKLRWFPLGHKSKLQCNLPDPSRKTGKTLEKCHKQIAWICASKASATISRSHLSFCPLACIFHPLSTTTPLPAWLHWNLCRYKTAVQSERTASVFIEKNVTKCMNAMDGNPSVSSLA